MNDHYSYVHVVPIDDLVTHGTSIYCLCKPKIEEVEEGAFVVVHNSYDGREWKEENKLV